MQISTHKIVHSSHITTDHIHTLYIHYEANEYKIKSMSDYNKIYAYTVFINDHRLCCLEKQ